MKAHDADVRASVMAALLAGQSVNRVAKDYHLPVGTIKSWKRQGFNDATPKKEIGDLLVEYLRVNLETMKAQAEFFSDPQWLAKQTAADNAVLHGVMTDKTIRLLEAFGATQTEE